jgi:hypothetical protein
MAKILHGTDCPVWTKAHQEQEPAREFSINSGSTLSRNQDGGGCERKIRMPTAVHEIPDASRRCAHPFHQPDACKSAIAHSLRAIQTMTTITITVPTTPNPSIVYLL